MRYAFLVVGTILAAIGRTLAMPVPYFPPANSVAHTQLAPPDTTLGKVIMVYIYQPGFGDNRAAQFSTDGQRIAGLTAAELNKKFSKNGYAVRVLNFLISNGYRVVGFAPARYGYNYLLEKVR